jgi:hypothetical protein
MTSFHPLLYMLNSAVLITHEIDSGYWKEWELFGTGGGIEVFLVMNFVLALLVLTGYRKLIEQSRAGYLFSCALALSGLAAFCIHSYFLATGHPEFGTTVSKSLLVATTILSIIQGPSAVLLYLKRPKNNDQPS